MSPKAVADAWDDDYDAVVNKRPSQSLSRPSAPIKTSRAERRAQHAEANKALWNSAENPDSFNFLAHKEEVPLKSEVKPAFKVLSRKPKPPGPAVPPTLVKRPQTLEHSINNLSIAPPLDDDPDSEEEARREQERTLAERTERARHEREEKQKKYAEVRERLFGSSNSSSKQNGSISGSTSPSRGGAAARGRTNRRAGSSAASPRASQQSSADQSPVRGSQQSRLYEHEYAPKPGSVYLQKKNAGLGAGLIPASLPPVVASRPVRSPRGPDASGNGFAARSEHANGA